MNACSYPKKDDTPSDIMSSTTPEQTLTQIEDLVVGMVAIATPLEDAVKGINPTTRSYLPPHMVRRLTTAKKLIEEMKEPFEELQELEVKLRAEIKELSQSCQNLLEEVQELKSRDGQ